MKIYSIGVIATLFPFSATALLEHKDRSAPVLSLTAKKPMNRSEIKAVHGDHGVGQSLIAPPKEKSEGHHRLLQKSSSQRISPSAGETIGAEHSFTAAPSNNQGASRVVFRIQAPDGFATADFDADFVPSSGLYQVDFTGFTDGNWAWQVWVLDQQGNWTFTAFQSFTVRVGGGGGGTEIG